MPNPFEAAVSSGKPPPSAAGMVSPHDIDSSGKMFLKAPKTIQEAIIASNITNDEKSPISAFYFQCCEFEMASLDDEMMIWLLTELACRRGQRGSASVLALETSVGAISEIATTSALGLKGADELAKRVRERRDKDEKKVEKGRVQD